MSLPTSDWLHLAKRLPVGASKRVYHLHEVRANLVVQNHGDRWSCYCHRCHEGGVVRKEHAVPEPVKQERFTVLPKDVLHYTQLDIPTQLRIVNFLTSKGVDYETMIGHPWFSALTQRIIFPTSQGFIGRTIVNAEPKWCHYVNPGTGQYPAFATHTYDVISVKPVVLTEDYLSALKVRWAVPEVVPIALLGTRLSPKLLHELCCAQPSYILGFFDGDAAGDAADVSAGKRLRGLGLNYLSVSRTRGYDPKDHYAAELQTKIREVLCGTPDTPSVKN